MLLIFSHFTKSDIYRAKHDDFIKYISPEINKILISHDLCSDKNDCSKKQIFFYAPGGRKLYISFYSITDLEIIREIINKTLLVYTKNNISTSIQVEAFEHDHSERGGLLKQFFSKNEPFLTMSIKEKE